MNENKHGCLELPPANLKSQIWADGQRETVIRKPQFVGKTVSSESSDKISQVSANAKSSDFKK